MCSLSKEVNLIKKFNRFRLLEITEHCAERLKTRGIDSTMIWDVINERQTRIIQYHEPYTYNRNKDDVFVLHGKINTSKIKTPIHIIIAKHVDAATNVTHYMLMTAYFPSDKLFAHYGRVLKRR